MAMESELRVRRRGERGGSDRECVRERKRERTREREEEGEREGERAIEQSGAERRVTPWSFLVTGSNSRVYRNTHTRC